MVHSKGKTLPRSYSKLPYIVICCEAKICILAAQLFSSFNHLFKEENIYFISSFTLSLALLRFCRQEYSVFTTTNWESNIISLEQPGQFALVPIVLFFRRQSQTENFYMQLVLACYIHSCSNTHVALVVLCESFIDHLFVDKRRHA